MKGPFPRTIEDREIRKLEIGRLKDLEYTQDNLLLAIRRGDIKTAKGLRASIRRYDRREALKAFDRGFLRGALRKIRNRVRKVISSREPWDAPVFPNPRLDLEP